MNAIPIDILLSILVTITVVLALFSCSETALLTLSHYRLRHPAPKNHRAISATERLLKHPQRLSSLILLVNISLSILAASLTILLAHRTGQEQTVFAVLALLILMLLILSKTLSSILPAIHPEFIILLSTWLYIPVLYIFYPVVWFSERISRLLLRIFGLKQKKSSTTGTNRHSLKNFGSDNLNCLPNRYQNMLLSILDLETASVEDIMTHRNDIVGLDLDEPIENIIHKLQTSPHTRLPVYKKNIDRVIGFLHLRAILSQLSRPDFDKHALTENLLKPFFIPAGTSIHRQMQTFKSEKIRIGLVVDEYGDVLGLLTLDDLLQEIVGELISDEADIKLQSDGSYLVDASVTVREFNRVTQWHLPTEGPKTINGLILEYMETIPESGTSLKLYGHPLEIIKRDENAIKLVKFHH